MPERRNVKPNVASDAEPKYAGLSADPFCSSVVLGSRSLCENASVTGIAAIIISENARYGAPKPHRIAIGAPTTGPIIGPVINIDWYAPMLVLLPTLSDDISTKVIVALT